ncbi:NUDIX hydrolase [Raineyella sp. LH-20]|uniref:NUDIX hydrolase n=1 Tax=Raineyella sp. LH-20 TaxID=3081204 RepID=UPI002953EA96|nr:NUDIX domain-containing protein [Raineyella sp. LH-20]WOP17583.1 NUDIX domain-containing protein [Raineyella sp. LH-20]
MGVDKESGRGPLRDDAGVAKYRHEAIAAVLQVRVDPVTGAMVLSVLATRRRRAPYARQWALPSGPVEVDETIGQSARRHLAAKVDLAEVAHLEQLETLSDPGRDPYDRTIATAYVGLVPWTSDPALPAAAGWLAVDALPAMAFDHAAVVRHAVARMRAKLSYTNIGFALAPEEFTMAQLRDAYAAALGHEVNATNLQRILVRRGQLVATGSLSVPGSAGGRPGKVFRFATRGLTVTDPFATLRPAGAAGHGAAPGD